jgi:hypothetical protein
MATPNLVNVATINGFTINGAVTTSDTDIITVPSDYIYKINTIIITNIDGTNAQNVSLKVTTNGATTYFDVVSTVSVPADAVLVAIDKNSSFYLDETDRLRISCGGNSDLTYLVSGEKMTD